MRCPEMHQNLSPEVVDILAHGGVGVIPTDTIYGIVGSALKKNTVERIYKLRKRDPSKPFVVLIASPADLAKFGVSLEAEIKKYLAGVWPGPVSVVLRTKSKKFCYLHRGKGSVALRMPAWKPLLRLLKETGPLVAPSANLEGKPSAKTIREAKKYFGDRVDFYADAGRISRIPSTLITFTGGKIKILRAGGIPKK